MNTKAKIEEIKNAVRIENVVSGHVPLKSSGKNLIGLCPFHKDHNPSLTVYPETQSWHCYGCGKGGDVIQFQQEITGKNFRETLEELARKGGVSLSKHEDCSHREEDRIIEKIRLITVHCYQGVLFSEEGKAALNYLTTERGFSIDLIKDFRVGYAPTDKDSSNHYLKGKGLDVELGMKAGVLSTDNTDYFKGYLVFPNIVNGKIVTLQGRAFPNHAPKYMLEPGTIDHLIGEAALNRHKNVIVVEGWMDYLTLRQAGHENVVGIYGASGFKKEWVHKFDKADTVYLALDGDDAGKKGALRIAGFFKNSKCLIVPFPEIRAESEDKPSIKDWNDLYNHTCQKDTDSFKKSVDKSLIEAETRIDLKIENIKKLDPGKQATEIQDLLMDLVPLLPIEQGSYVEKISKEFKIGKRDLNKEIRLTQQKMIKQEPQNNEPQKVELSLEEKESAEKLLKDPELLKKFLQVMENDGCVGEKHILKLVYLVLTSRLLRKPIALVVKGESSSGKNYLVTLVSDYFPTSEIKVITKMTANALYYLSGNIKHKALIFQENPGTKDADYPLRSMQSEGFVTVLCPMKDEKTGTIETKEVRVEGPIAYIETTTRARLHAENETRLFSIYLNDSKEQNILIINKQAEVAQFGNPEKSAGGKVIQRDFINAQTLLKEYEVRIPYATLLTEKLPKDKIRIRRDHTRIHSLINASTILHQYQREKVCDGKTEYLKANIEDYRVAYELVPFILREAVMGRSKKSDELLQICRELIEKDRPESCEPTEFTKADLLHETKWSAPTVSGCLKELEYNGYIDKVGAGKHNAYVYKLTTRGKDPESKSLKFLPTPEEVEEAMRL